MYTENVLKSYTQPTAINLHPNGSIQGLCCYSFAANLDRYTGSCNTLNNTFGILCVSNEYDNRNK